MLLAPAAVFRSAQRDFLEADGYGARLGNDVTLLQHAVAPCAQVLAAARHRGAGTVLILHTREGHRADLADVHAHKQQRNGHVIGRDGPMGKVLLRGEPGHDIVPALYPLPHEPVIDKPGKVRRHKARIFFSLKPLVLKPTNPHAVFCSPHPTPSRIKGSFYATDLECILQARSIRTILVCGVTTEVCVHTTVREANDRGYHCVVVSDACASYRPDFHAAALAMITAQGGIFGSVTDARSVLAALAMPPR